MTKGQADFLELGGWNAICFMCGRKRKASTLRKQWQGYWVCPEHWEPRQTQDFVKGVVDAMSVPWAQPPQEDIFIGICTPQTRTGIAGYAEAGCALPNFIAPGFLP